ncbi:EAL domain-containing protein [Pseudodesulfovibrio sp. JC047]|uniref:EAL domain-containing response regulator n=1 Tax=Pseudodesulfovibrio sp. JC047 TaxID=2683199 RepID=UPI0013D0BA9D|nr:EAL domain-containing protein [Pseudodesulfovibrio sp. JC047]NDV20551.1 EAL domain-containing protein [Pseudodesulfovibrio sp. JC047]
MSEIVDVLVVDDERINLKLVEGILKGHDLNLVMVSSGSQALECLSEYDFAVALLDVMMPGMDGFELAEQLRSTESFYHIPIIFITAISKDQRHVFRGYELGAVDYLFKPVEPEVLRSKINIFADLHRKKRYLEETTSRLEATVEALEASRMALEKSEQRYRLVADYNYDWECWIGPEGDIRYISPSCERISGYAPELFADDPELLERIVHPDDRVRWLNFMTDSAVGGEANLDFRIYDANVKVRWLSLIKHAIRTEEGTDLGIRISMRDVTSRKRMEEQLKHSALHDMLTGLPNRVLFLDRLGRAADRSVEGNDFYAVLFINLDRFQAVNDHYGHTVGDTLMVSIGEKLLGLVRPLDTVARFGGDEFGILIHEMDSIDAVASMIQTIHDSFKQAIVIDGVKFNVSASVGYDIASGAYVELEELVHNAQVAMNKAKESGKNRFVAYHKSMREGVINILALENELKRALTAREFEAYYQPIVNLADGRLYGFEALVRWNHPERGLVNPGEFIPVAEETGIIVDLGKQVLEQACTAMNAWRQQYRIAAELNIAVNISAKQFNESSLAVDVAQILERSGLPPECLKLEITETVVMLDAMKSVNQLNLLKKLGILLSIDDFGTGYSSMNYLQKFPTDQLKVDLSFVQRMESAPENIEIIRAIVNMAHSLRLRVVAEGIETERQRDLLYSLQCDYGQGYLYSKPLCQADAENFIKNSE